MGNLRVDDMTMDQVRVELARWQMGGLAGEVRTKAERNRIADLWHRIDISVRARDRERRNTRKVRRA